MGNDNDSQINVSGFTSMIAMFAEFVAAFNSARVPNASELNADGLHWDALEHRLGRRNAFRCLEASTGTLDDQESLQQLEASLMACVGAISFKNALRTVQRGFENDKA